VVAQGQPITPATHQAYSALAARTATGVLQLDRVPEELKTPYRAAVGAVQQGSPKEGSTLVSSITSAQSSWLPDLGLTSVDAATREAVLQALMSTQAPGLALSCGSPGASHQVFLSRTRLSELGPQELGALLQQGATNGGGAEGDPELRSSLMAQLAQQQGQEQEQGIDAIRVGETPVEINAQWSCTLPLRCCVMVVSCRLASLVPC
jgi:hypothetical protein